jgi:hypothetical protein
MISCGHLNSSIYLRWTQSSERVYTRMSERSELGSARNQLRSVQFNTLNLQLQLVSPFHDLNNPGNEAHYNPHNSQIALFLLFIQMLICHTGTFRQDLSSGCTSIVFLLGNQSDSECSVLLLAGHRHGLLVMLHCQIDVEGSLRVSKNASQYSIGSTPVIIKKDIRFLNAAVICCDSKVWRVCYDNSFYSDPPLNRVWFTDVEKVSVVSRIKLFH